MADNTTVHIGENSPEQVAYRLFRHVADAEDKILVQGSARGEAATRKWIIDTYAECLYAVKNPHKRSITGTE